MNNGIEIAGSVIGLILLMYIQYRIALAAARKAIWEYAQVQNQIKQEETIDEIEKDIKAHINSKEFESA